MKTFFWIVLLFGLALGTLWWNKRECVNYQVKWRHWYGETGSAHYAPIKECVSYK